MTYDTCMHYQFGFENKMRKILVFGASGFIGSHIVHQFLTLPTEKAAPPSTEISRNKITLIGVSRCASRVQDDLKNLQTAHASSLKQIQWDTCDTLDRESIAELFARHPETTAVISCIGGFGSSEDAMRKANGPPNINLVHAITQHASVEKFVYVSAAQIINKNFTRLLRGYYNGKQGVEDAMEETLGSRSVILQPGFVYGKRLVGERVIPLGIIGKPLECLTKPVYNKLGWKFFTPPIDANCVARCAIAACIGRNGKVHGKMDANAMHSFVKENFGEM